MMRLADDAVWDSSRAIWDTFEYREPIGAPPSAYYREVGFDATDGVDISAWYRPTQNGADLAEQPRPAAHRDLKLANVKIKASAGRDHRRTSISHTSAS